MNEGPSAAERLIAAYPQLYSNVPCGLDVPDGWLQPLLDLSAAVVSRGVRVRVEQVKQKFGGLRFYHYLLDDDGRDIEDLVAVAELRCIRTCERCGATRGVTTGGHGWTETLCASCRGV